MGFDATFIISLVVVLAFSCTVWNIFVLGFVFKAAQLNTTLTEGRPLKRWVLKALTTMVVLFTIGLMLLAIAQVIRNYYLVDAVELGQVPEWLFVVVVLQNIIYFSVGTIPGLILFIYCWALKTINAEREDRLDAQARAYIGIESETTRRAERGETTS